MEDAVTFLARGLNVVTCVFALWAIFVAYRERKGLWAVKMRNLFYGVAAVLVIVLEAQIEFLWERIPPTGLAYLYAPVFVFLGVTFLRDEGYQK